MTKLIMTICGFLILGGILLALEPDNDATAIVVEINEPNTSGTIVAEDVTIEWPVEANNNIAMDGDLSFQWMPVDTITMSLSDFNIFLTDPFTLIIDDVEKQFTHEEFKRRLGFNTKGQADE